MIKTDGKIDITWQQKLLNAIPHPCKYGNYGCKETMMVKELTFHEEQCDYRKVNCVVNGCNVDVCFINYLDHLMYHL